MGRFWLWLILIGAAFFGSFFAGKKRTQFLLHAPTRQVRFLPTDYPIVHRPFVLFVTARNQGAHIEKTLRSIFMQNYDNFRLVYIDDASTDGSFALVRDLVYEWGYLERVTLLQNDAPLGDLANLARAVSNSLDDEIIVPIGAEGYLAHEWVLQRLNQYYADPELWLTIGAARDYPRFSPADISFKTFYARLLKEGGPTLDVPQEHTCALNEAQYIRNREAL